MVVIYSLQKGSVLFHVSHDKINDFSIMIYDHKSDSKYKIPPFIYYLLKIIEESNAITNEELVENKIISSAYIKYVENGGKEDFEELLKKSIKFLLCKNIVTSEKKS